MSENYIKGIKLAILTAVVSGIANFANKFAVDAIKPPLIFTSTRNSFVGLVILGLIILSGKWKGIFKLSRKETVQLLAISIIGGAIPFYLYFTGLSMIPAINASMIHKTLVFWVTIMAIPLLKEKFSATKITAVFLLFNANFLIGGFTRPQFSTGELMVLAATTFWAIETVIAKFLLKTIDPDLLVTARMGLGSLILLAATRIVYPNHFNSILNLNPSQWVWMSLSVITLLLYTTSWYRALKFAQATTVTAVLVSATLITNSLSAIFVTHQWASTLNLQGFVMILGISLLLIETLKNSPSRLAVSEHAQPL
jgi:drug/metabolite transporter (DMT)-like permease